MRRASVVLALLAALAALALAPGGAAAVSVDCAPGAYIGAGFSGFDAGVGITCQSGEDPINDSSTAESAVAESIMGSAQYADLASDQYVNLSIRNAHKRKSVCWNKALGEIADGYVEHNDSDSTTPSKSEVMQDAKDEVDRCMSEGQRLMANRMRTQIGITRFTYLAARDNSQLNATIGGSVPGADWTDKGNEVYNSSLTTVDGNDTYTFKRPEDPYDELKSSNGVRNSVNLKISVDNGTDDAYPVYEVGDWRGVCKRPTDGRPWLTESECRNKSSFHQQYGGANYTGAWDAYAYHAAVLRDQVNVVDDEVWNSLENESVQPGTLKACANELNSIDNNTLGRNQLYCAGMGGGVGSANSTTGGVFAHFGNITLADGTELENVNGTIMGECVGKAGGPFGGTLKQNSTVDLSTANCTLFYSGPGNKTRVIDDESTADVEKVYRQSENGTVTRVERVTIEKPYEPPEASSTESHIVDDLDQRFDRIKKLLNEIPSDKPISLFGGGAGGGSGPWVPQLPDIPPEAKAGAALFGGAAVTRWLLAGLSGGG